MVTSEGTILTDHAMVKMQRRAIRDEAVEAVINYGRETHVRGAIIYAIGKKEIEAMMEEGIDLSSYDGIHVICTKDGVVMTTYRNKDLKSLHYRGWVKKRHKK